MIIYKSNKLFYLLCLWSKTLLFFCHSFIHFIEAIAFGIDLWVWIECIIYDSIGWVEFIAILVKDFISSFYVPIPLFSLLLFVLVKWRFFSFSDFIRLNSIFSRNYCDNSVCIVLLVFILHFMSLRLLH